ncbi:protein NO VEIN domain-containing protein [Hydrogenophaga sp.]|uniref:protein NO VEIN domain-containing protein n=1 Tax=Hydrogenophaga sp. TaxID=1904254 RepID=UPI0035B2DA96
MKEAAQAFTPEARIKRHLRQHLTDLGFTKDESGALVLPDASKATVRTLHRKQREDKLAENAAFIANHLPSLQTYFASGTDVRPEAIRPVLQLVTGTGVEAKLFRLASLTWSVPVSSGFGRRMRYLVWDQSIGKLIGIFAIGELTDFTKVIADAPARRHIASDAAPYRDYAPVKRDYIAREARNTTLGLAGEEFVVRFEHWRLNQLGQTKLADRVEHVSQTRGDGLGYDVLSFDANGKERFIEVKTTAFSKETPFFVTRNELNFSKDASDHFVLCRLFEFRLKPRLFALNGALDQHCALDPVTYRASFA